MSPRENVATQAESNQLRRESQNEQTSAQYIDLVPNSSFLPIWRRIDVSCWELQNDIAHDQSKQRDWNLQQEAPAPSDGINDGTSEGSTTDGSEAVRDVLDCLVHTSLAEGNEIRVDDCC